ncbi:MAG: hypothetical protein H5U07_02010 [Candidatus Aminicenantes bacterium]|nr:hypothetical protein [Candidatus Aminicenantes bacterium]
MAEAVWHGLLEEDGLDFIIYHLASNLKRWEIQLGKKSLRLKSPPFPRPDFRVDYVEGLEKEIRFYYSFQPSEIIWSGENTAVSFKLLLPSSPRAFKKEPGANDLIKTTGSRIVVIERKALENPVVQKEVFWQAEVSDRLLPQKKEVFSVWLKLFLKRLSS